MADYSIFFPLQYRGDPDPRRMALASSGFRWRAGLWRRGRVVRSDADLDAMDAQMWAQGLRRWPGRRPRPPRCNTAAWRGAPP
jgi:hypothetical protein